MAVNKEYLKYSLRKRIRKTRHVFARMFIPLIIVITLVPIMWMLRNLVFEKNYLAHATMNDKVERLVGNANNVLQPIAMNLTIIEDWGMQNLIDLDDQESLYSRFRPMLEHLPLVSSMMILKASTPSFFMYRQDSTWQFQNSNIDSLDNLALPWKNFNRDSTQGSTSEYSNFERFANSISRLDQNKKNGHSIMWTSAYNMPFLQDSVISGVVKWNADSIDSTEIVIALNVKTSSIIEMMSKLPVEESERHFLVNKYGTEIGLLTANPIGIPSMPENVAILERDTNYNALIDSALFKWKNEAKFSKEPFELIVDGTSWWSKFRAINKNNESIVLGLIISQNDLLHDFQKKRNSSIAIIVIILLAGGTLVFLYSRFYRNPANIFANQDGAYPLSDQDLKSLIKSGESSTLEFKSSLRWDFNKNEVNKRLQDVILKSIAAFSNSHGGQLFIGINDDGDILGLENDYASLKKNDKDYFELHLRNLINNAYTIGYATNFITLYFPTIAGKEICIIVISEGDEPLFTMSTDKNGTKLEKFYIRSGNASREFDQMSEVFAYINKRFKQHD
jgi:hypothetical protein